MQKPQKVKHECPAMRDWIAILDFGSQYTQLIARRVRECGIYSEIYPFSIDIRSLISKKPGAIILSGGPATVTSDKSPVISRRLFDSGIPILGICYGMQLTAKVLGGKVESSSKREYGHSYVSTESKSALFKGISCRINAWMSHGDRVLELPPGFKVIARTGNAPIAAMSNSRKKIYGVQFHPEVVHTPEGKKILDNFIKKIAGCSVSWTMSSFVKDTIGKIKNQVKDEHVICGVSGGVDSSVLALLLSKAVGANLTCIFVNNGLLRRDEGEQVVKRFRENYHIDLLYIDAAESFLRKLKGVVDPERKRKIIGKEFIRVFESQAKKIGKVKFLAQGTLYPDVIESVSVFGGPSATIKTHHNVGGLPSKMHFKLIEPFRFLFKDEVRKVGEELGLPESIIWRQPFPGPGLGVRIISEITRERLRILREADALIQEEIKKAGLYRKIWQSFGVLLPVKTVGVMGDERTYENVIAIRAVTSNDGMTADWVRFPHELLKIMANRIINEVKGVNRVVYDISTKPPSTIEWE